MDVKRVVSIQAARGASSNKGATVQKSIDAYISECRHYLQENSDSFMDYDPETRRQNTKNLIVKFVMENSNALITGFTDGTGNKADTNKLINKLVEDITDYSILTKAMLDPSIYEIRCNGKEIKVEISGSVQDLMDEDGNIVSFESTQQQDIIMRKLLGDIRFTPKDAIVNGSTVEGYRIAAVHSSATSRDPNDPTGEMYHSFVLRKFKKSKMNLADIVKFGTLSDNMAKLLSLTTKGGLTWFTVGPTASGKTTTNNAILQEMPPTTRTVLIQNPSEIDLRMKDESGRVYNDVIHLEAKEKEHPTPSDPTMQNLMTHTLRLSPTFVCFGELRTNPEFKLGLQIAQAGHPINCTFHSESSVGAVRRFLTAYLAESGNEPSDLALMTLTDLVRIIVVQKIMRDGRRRIIQISEVCGVMPDNPNMPDVRDLFVFELDGKVDFDDAGNVKKIYGRHKRVGCLSNRTIEILKLEGVSKEMYEFMTVPPEGEVETYDGKSLEELGL